MNTLTVFGYGTLDHSSITRNIIYQFSQACVSEHVVIEGSNLWGTDVKPHTIHNTRIITEWLLSQESDDNSINFVGFSRGSVTCIQVANRLKRIQTSLERREATLEGDDRLLLRRLHALQLDIFALDPVAGFTDKANEGARRIPKNVSSYTATLQIDEMRQEFKPQDMTRLIIESSEDTKVSLLPMFGNHTAINNIKEDDKKNGAFIAWNSLYQFLLQHGTKLRDNKIPAMIYQNEPQDLNAIANANELLSLYSAFHEERNAYLTTAMAMNLRDGLPAPRIKRTMNNHLKYYVKDPAFFVNQIERELFKICYPRVFNYLFEKNLPDIRFPQQSASTKAEVIAELSLLRENDSLLFNRLKKRGVKVSSQQNIFVGPARGHYNLESCANLHQLMPDVLPASVTEHLEEFKKLRDLENEIYRFTFQYERDKQSFKFYGNRHESKRTQSIRELVNYAVNELAYNNETKIRLVLNILEAHYAQLVQSNSRSELRSMLEKVLHKHNRHYHIESLSLAKSILASMVDIILSAIKEMVYFIGHLGYVGGAIFHIIGTYMEEFGKRCNQLLGDLGYNPAKYVASALSYTITLIGLALKNILGLKPLTELIYAGIVFLRDSTLHAIRADEIIRQPDSQFLGEIVNLGDYQITNLKASAEREEGDDELPQMQPN